MSTKHGIASAGTPAELDEKPIQAEPAAWRVVSDDQEPDREPATKTELRCATHHAGCLCDACNWLAKRQRSKLHLVVHPNESALGAPGVEL